MEDPQSRRHRTHPTTDRTDPANTSSPRKLVRSSRLTSPVDTVFLRLWVPSINLVGVAVQEMHHLARVNELLGQLRAPPNLVRQDFPYETTSTRPGDQLLTSDPDDLRSLVAERGIPVTVVPV